MDNIEATIDELQRLVGSISCDLNLYKGQQKEAIAIKESFVNIIILLIEDEIFNYGPTEILDDKYKDTITKLDYFIKEYRRTDKNLESIDSKITIKNDELRKCAGTALARKMEIIDLRLGWSGYEHQYILAGMEKEVEQVND